MSVGLWLAMAYESSSGLFLSLNKDGPGVVGHDPPKLTTPNPSSARRGILITALKTAPSLWPWW